MNGFFFGLGYSAQATIDALRADETGGLTLAGTSRSAEAVARLANGGIAAHVFDGEQPGATLGADLRGASHVVSSIAPSAGADPVLARHRDDLDRAGGLEWLCYYSTVGVYGDFGGAWIDETATRHPVNQRSRDRVAVEQYWQDYAAARGVPLLILRLSGIYGPGRSSFDKLLDGTARRIVKKGQVFNRIHVEDIGRVTALAAQRRLGGTFNLTDDLPAPPQDVVEFAAALEGTEPPPEVAFETAEMTPMARSFYSDNKRVSNAAIKKALGIELLYPSYREGLTAIFTQHELFR
ncbi:MAG TPA: SDR family oxidoreductase [Devosiaceae bacterium]|jgi:nucleoside-diphosphate-sugar epimerase